MLTCRWSAVRWTRIAISYATWPMSASLVVRTARHVPWPAADTMKKPDVISMIDCRASPPKVWLALRASDWNAAASAARCSTSA
jgi:hypothetical protein